LIVVDTSALIAILKREGDAEAHLACLVSDGDPFISTFSDFEARVVLIRAGRANQLAELDALVVQARIRHRAFDPAQAERAAAAYARFGRGTGHPARLNLADCAAYALAMSLDAPLLYKGNDFARTDVPSALESFPIRLDRKRRLPS